MSEGGSVTIIHAPFPPEVVEALNRYQQAGQWHPFTCRRRNESPHGWRWGDKGTLRATEAGWVCDDCDYTQDWAHDFMGDVLLFLKEKP
jgi:hypothetical protein